MPIDLGLSRVTKLLQHLGNPHYSYKSIHIAGTNGKGSTVAYLSSIITQSNIRNGRFTSPHMLYYNDCICINNKAYPTSKFTHISQLVNEQNLTLQLNCTDFELLTVTAFKIFEQEKVELAIIEVGLGGRLDATNVLQPCEQRIMGGVIATGITKIGIDHESFLGTSIADIAYQKAGIIKKGIPCVADGTNKSEALSVIEEQARLNGSELTLVGSDEVGDAFALRASMLLRYSPLKGNYQLQNLSIALKIIDIVMAQDYNEYTMEDGRSKILPESITSGISKANWPGRLQSVHIDTLGFDVLLDGAHNESAAEELGKFLQEYRGQGKGLILVIGITQGKNVENLLKHIVIKEKDTLIPALFLSPDKMPWVSSYDPNLLRRTFKNYSNLVVEIKEHDVQSIIKYLKDIKLHGDDRQIVICGSLYLCADFLRWIQNGER
ncbi:uncharacterized protein PRCAT00001795001 [Priceomyces carsonii]|uniref:uncharacterized protein n=1 Tax=Priceomyces carsonii TaxID=28549 RepID=UPI002EDB4F31|nr:unnamed protein product [Priceomyces carsonii]